MDRCDPRASVRSALGVALVCAVTIAVYARSLSGGLVYEDQRGDNAPVTLAQAGAWPGPRWVTTQSYALTSALYGATARPARVVSLGWHLLNGILLWVVARRVVTEAAAVFAAGVFLLHPMQTEAVAGIAYRGELVAATWALLALWCVSRGWRVAAGLIALGAVTGKEAAITAVGLVPLWAWATGQRWSRRAVAVTALALVLALGGMAVLLWHRSMLGIVSVDGLPKQVTALTRLLTLVVWPSGLTIDHHWAALTPTAVILAVWAWTLAAMVAPLLRWPLWSVALLGTVIALGPRLLLDLGEGLHERHLYTPMLLIAMAIGAGLFPKDVHA